MNERARHFRKNMACTSINKCLYPNGNHEDLNVIVLPQTPQLKVSLIDVSDIQRHRPLTRASIPFCGTRRHPGRILSLLSIDSLLFWSRRLWSYFHTKTRSSSRRQKRRLLEKNSISRYVQCDHLKSPKLIDLLVYLWCFYHPIVCCSAFLSNLTQIAFSEGVRLKRVSNEC